MLIKRILDEQISCPGCYVFFGRGCQVNTQFRKINNISCGVSKTKLFIFFMFKCMAFDHCMMHIDAVTKSDLSTTCCTTHISRGWFILGGLISMQKLSAAQRHHITLLLAQHAVTAQLHTSRENKYTEVFGEKYILQNQNGLSVGVFFLLFFF